MTSKEISMGVHSSATNSYLLLAIARALIEILAILEKQEAARKALEGEGR